MKARRSLLTARGLLYFGALGLLLLAPARPARADAADGHKLSDQDLQASGILVRDPPPETDDCRTNSCPGLAPVAVGSQCKGGDDGETRYFIHAGYAEAYGKRMAELNQRTRDFFTQTGTELIPDYILPEDVQANSLRVAGKGRRHWDKKQKRWIASEVHNVQFISDRQTGRVFEMQIVVESPPGDPSGRVTRIYWDPRLGYKDSNNMSLIGAEALPGQTLEDKGAAFDALVGRYMSQASQCPFVKQHLLARAKEQDPALSVVNQFFESCSKSVSLCLEKPFGANPMPSAPTDLLSPVVDALSSEGTPGNDDPAVVNQRFNLELIHSLRMGLLGTQAQLLARVADDPAFANFRLGNQLTPFAAGGNAAPSIAQPACDFVDAQHTYQFNGPYIRETDRLEKQARDASAPARASRDASLSQANQQVVGDLLELAFYKCQAKAASGGAPDSVKENLFRLLDGNPELKLMGGKSGDLFKILRDHFAPQGFDFSAYDSTNHHCQLPAARDAFRKLADAVRAQPVDGPLLKPLFENARFTDALRGARLTALNTLRKAQAQTSSLCMDSSTAWDPTWRPSWLGGDDEGVPLWKDRPLVEDIVRRYAGAQPPRLIDLQRFRKVLCQNRDRQSGADKKKEWVDLGVNGGLVVVSFATMGVGGELGLAVRAGLGVADLAAGVAQGQAMVGDARASLAHLKLLSAGGYASQKDVDAAASALESAYWGRAISIAGSALALADIAPLARSAFVKSGSSWVKREGTDAIVHALGEEGREIPSEILSQAVLACSGGDCEKGHQILALWARRGAAENEPALRAFLSEDWEAYARYSKTESALEAEMNQAFKAGELEKYEGLRKRLEAARRKVTEFLEGRGSKCAL